MYYTLVVPLLIFYDVNQSFENQIHQALTSFVRQLMHLG